MPRKPAHGAPPLAADHGPTPPLATLWRNRIVCMAEVDPRTLEPHFLNWRKHTPKQHEALTGALGEVGWVRRILVNQRTGRLLDGHLRLALALKHKEPLVPVMYVDLDEAEERLVLATLDPITAMATSNTDMYLELLQDVTIDSAALQDLTALVLADGPELDTTYHDTMPEPGDAPTQTDVQDTWQIIIT